MKRYALSLAILAVGLFWISVGAPVWGGQSLLEHSTPAPKPSPTATPDSSEEDAEVMAIVLEDKAMEGMLTGRQEGRDYWVIISHTDEYRDAPDTGEKPIAMVDIFFDPPISYEGEFPVILSDPCSGHYGEDESLDPGDPCMDEPSEYGSKYLDLTGAEHIVAKVDLRRQELVDVFPLSIPVSQRTIDDVKSRYAP